MMFADEGDAKRVLDVLPKRFAKYGLTLHPEKTKMVAFERPDRPSRIRDRGEGAGPARPETFDFLGFTPLHPPLGQKPRWASLGSGW